MTVHFSTIILLAVMILTTILILQDALRMTPDTFLLRLTPQ
jgi:hypothetical protein